MVGPQTGVFILHVLVEVLFRGDPLVLLDHLMDGAGVNIPLLVIQVLIWGQPLVLLVLLVQRALLIWSFPLVLLAHLVEGEGGCSMFVLNTYRFTATVCSAKSTMRIMWQMAGRSLEGS